MRPQPDSEGPLRVIVVQQDAIVGFELATELAERGMRVCGPFSHDHEALPCLDEGADAAIIDLVEGEAPPSLDFARRLRDRGIPFIVFSGRNPRRAAPGEDWAHLRWIEKPAPPARVIDALRQAAEQGATLADRKLA